MSIKLGSSDISKVYLGATEVSKIYLGVTEVYSANRGYISTYNTNNTELPYSSGSDSLRIPLVGTGLTIDWGDGNVDTGVTSSEASPSSHTYSTSGIYTVEVSGNLTKIRYDNDRARDLEKIISISQWGDIAWTSFDSAYNGCSNVVGSFTDAPDLSNVTNFFEAFRTALYFNSSVNNWDMSNVTNIGRMFYTASSFDQNLDTWDITNISSMTNFLFAIGLSTSNYDAILIGWEATLQAAYPSGTGYSANINVNFGSSEYTGGGAAATARASLISTFGWTISDGGIA